MVEFVFMQHFFQLGSTYVSGSDAFTPLNTVVAFQLLFYTIDFFYYWAHRLMHHPVVYPLCHKHHHRQSMPRRGYWDAANEHPMEQVIGLSCVYLGTEVVNKYCGVHQVTLIVFFAIYALMAMMNHTVYDIDLGWLFVGYNVGAHEMHHRYGKACNFGQDTMFWDMVFGTHETYRVKARKGTIEKSKYD